MQGRRQQGSRWVKGEAYNVRLEAVGIYYHKNQHTLYPITFGFKLGEQIHDNVFEKDCRLQRLWFTEIRFLSSVYTTLNVRSTL